MALRVLLADESSTIKKVFQLALQDYAVEVKSVNLGVDVLPVAQKYKPDVIFADVLLQKQSGYEVCAELKRDPQLQKTPIVLMWSGFMELDQDKFDASGANGKLEKPFDVKTLRQLVQDLVPKTKSQELSKYLQFPPLPEFVEETKKSEPAKNASTTPSSPSPPSFVPSAQSITSKPPASNWSMEDFAAVSDIVNSPADHPEGLKKVELSSHAHTSSQRDKRSEEFSSSAIDLENFKQVNLTSLSPLPASAARLPESNDGELLIDTPEDQVSAWSQQDISRFQVQIPVDEEAAAMPEVSYKTSIEPIHPDQVLYHPSSRKQEVELELDEENLNQDQTEDEVKPIKEWRDQLINGKKIEELIKEKLEELVKEKSSKMLEEVVWKVVPELAERIIERELKRLLDEFEPQQYNR